MKAMKKIKGSSGGSMMPPRKARRMKRMMSGAMKMKKAKMGRGY